MKAIVCPKYGSPGVLQLQEVAKPAPQDDEVLIRTWNNNKKEKNEKLLYIRNHFDFTDSLHSAPGSGDD